MQNNSKKLGKILVELKIISKAQLNEALAIQKKVGGRLGQILKTKGLITSTQLLKALEQQLNIPYFKYEDGSNIEPEAVKKINESLAKKLKAVPIQIKNNYLTVAMRDPWDHFALDDLKIITGSEIKPVITLEEDIDKIIEKFFDYEGTIKKAVKEVRPAEPKKTKGYEDDVYLNSFKAPIAELVNRIIDKAVQDNATDIHIEPGESFIRIRFRIDGLLVEKTKVPKGLLSSLITRIKLMSNMDIAEKRLPQDGKIKFYSSNKKIDLRVSVIPTIYGEKAVIRILNKNNIMLTIDKLGFSKENYNVIEKITKAPHGMILVTGPTGCGKTTTLYAILNKLKSYEKNLTTLEDPVEYSLEGVNQVQVNPKIGLSFAKGLRSILRQDPNVIMVGEIRDKDTARIAVRAALTGHMVLTTLHTNNSASAVTRLIEMGVEPFLVASSVICVIAQRLVRKICKSCKREFVSINQDFLFDNKRAFKNLFYGKGCRHCYNTGYSGRTVIAEVMEVTSKYNELIINKESSNTIQSYAINQGMKTMREDGIELVSDGVTTIEELNRVLFF